MVRMVFVVLTLVLTGTALGQDQMHQSQASAPQAGDHRTPVVITDAAEYNAYTSAIKIADPEARAYALEAFARDFPYSVLTPQALWLAADALEQGPAHQTGPSTDQIVIKDPAEYQAYITALNVHDPEARASALEDFVRQFPDSRVRAAALRKAAEASREASKKPRLIPSRTIAAPAKAPTPQERACKILEGKDAASLSFEEWEFVLQYRDSGAACNKDGAERVWRGIQNLQTASTGKPRQLALQVKVISATSKALEAAITFNHQKSNISDLKVKLNKPMTAPPAPGASVTVVGFLSAYSPRPFVFIMTDAAVQNLQKTETGSVIPASQRK
jgi:hypothetical protein